MQTSIVSVRVIYADVDRMNVVHHANYFRFFESARTEFIRRRGVSYAEVEATGVILPIVDVHVRFHSPARYDDLLDVKVSVTELKHASVTFAYEVRRAGETTILATGSTMLACCTSAGRPTRMPPAIRAMLEQTERSERGESAPG